MGLGRSKEGRIPEESGIEVTKKLTKIFSTIWK